MIKCYPGKESDYDTIARLCNHHDHLKFLSDSYFFMKQTETYNRMIDRSFHCDPVRMKELEGSYFTSLLIKLSNSKCKKLFDNVEEPYIKIKRLIKEFHRHSEPEIYFDSAHITIKSIVDNKKQNMNELKKYIPIIKDIVDKWINKLGGETTLYGMGLFSNLHTAKGLSLGIRFYPNLPLVQIIRGDVGNALYRALTESELETGDLRSEHDFHTTLTHSTGFRARDLEFPVHPTFIKKFRRIIEEYDRTVFGSITDITLEDIFIRNGKSDKLIVYNRKNEKVGEEISLQDVG